MNYKLITLMVGVGLSALTGCQSNATRENLSVSNPTIGSDIINGTVVNARGGRPGSWEHTHIVFQFDKGEPVKILEEIIDPNPYPEYPKKWLRVQVPSDVGLWAHGAYLATSSVINNSAQVTASLLNIRGGSSIVGGLPEAPGINYPILCRLPRGATVQLTGAREGDWVEILAPTNASVYVAEPYVGQRRKADRFNVENMIRQYAGWPYGELTQADYDEVTWLSFKYEEVDDPSVLAEFNLTKLNDLDLNETSVTDLSFLSGFTGLEILRLEETKISNLSPLKGLKKLERLYVTDTPNLTAKEIEKLQQALPDCKIYRYVTEHDGHQFRGPSPVIDAWVRKEPQVTPPKPTPPKEPPVPPLPEPNAIPTPHLNLPPNREPSPPPLEDSHHLVSIYDLESLAKLKNLEILELNQNQIDNLTPLAGHKNLKDLDLGYNRISDLTPLTGLKELKSLTLGENAISDLTPLSKLKGLETLHLCNYKITNLKPLANLKDLKNLNLGKNQITDLTPLAGLTELKWLDPGVNPITDLTPLAGLKKLKELDLSGTKITDLTPLAGLTELERLNLAGTQITDLSPLAKLTQLIDLNLTDTQVTDLSPLAKLTQLIDLNLTDTQVTDLTPLTSLNRLWNLNLSGTQVADLAPLKSLTGMDALHLDNTKVTNLAPLNNLGLRSLYLGFNWIMDPAGLSNLRQLKFLNLCGYMDPLSRTRAQSRRFTASKANLELMLPNCQICHPTCHLLGWEPMRGYWFSQPGQGPVYPDPGLPSLTPPPIPTLTPRPEGVVPLPRRDPDALPPNP